MEQSIQTILEPNEKVVWHGKQDLKASLIKGFSGLFFFSIFASILFFASNSGGSCTINGQIRPASDCAGTMGIVAYVILGMALLSPIFTYLTYKVTNYVITNKRLILKSGLIGADMRSVYYDQIKSAFVNVGLVGKIFGTGTILIDTGRITSNKNGTRAVYDRFSNIKNPYEIYKHIQGKISTRKESLYSGRADFESNPEAYRRMRK